ncbi:two-component system QseEF-associated lipoprotein QseG [Sodalis sp. RH21]|uniref:two-component system QseEF-associated lipoprotein QseG n=1 Tax=unclassified Sodalis (in: enterobacteria) TaxID=2636512 RepID=UPI0039B51717
MNLRTSPAIYRLAHRLNRLMTLSARAMSRARISAPMVLAPMMLAPMLLAGCAGHSARSDLSSLSPDPVQQATPHSRMAAECNELWQNDDKAALSDAGYWLRAMQCAERITPSQARAEAENQNGETWHDAFRQSILLNSAGISVVERRQSYQHLLGFRSQFPASIYPLFKMWRQQQALRLMLADERSRSQRQQEASASQIDQMRVQQIELQRKLDITSRKLENLTEIERRLSARKQLLPDNDEDDTAVPAAGGHGATGQSQGAGSQ